MNRFGRALTWLPNAAYQILTVSRGSRVLVRFNLALVNIDRKPALLIDAIETHPQTRELLSRPTARAATPTGIGMTYIRELSRELGRSLYATPIVGHRLVNANVTAGTPYAENPRARGPAQYLYDVTGVRRALHLGADVELAPFYTHLRRQGPNARAVRERQRGRSAGHAFSRRDRFAGGGDETRIATVLDAATHASADEHQVLIQRAPR